MDMDISMDIHVKSVDMDMDMDVKIHIHGNPGILTLVYIILIKLMHTSKLGFLEHVQQLFSNNRYECTAVV